MHERPISSLKHWPFTSISAPRITTRQEISTLVTRGTGNGVCHLNSRDELQKPGPSLTRCGTRPARSWTSNKPAGVECIGLPWVETKKGGTIFGWRRPSEGYDSRSRLSLTESSRVSAYRFMSKRSGFCSRSMISCVNAAPMWPSMIR